MKCSICGKECDHFEYYGDICSHECFDKWFWTKTLDGNAIIIDGVCYHDGGRVDKNYRGFIGFGGREWLIAMSDGRIISTNNLWHNGTVPEEYREQHPDNAKFISMEDYKNANTDAK